MEDRDWFVRELISRLVEEEFFVSLNSSSTGSKYLELDFGMGIRIRVSDHSISKTTRAYVSVQPSINTRNIYVRYVVQLSRSHDAVSEVVNLANEYRKRRWAKTGYSKYKHFLEKSGKSAFFVSDMVLSTYELFGKRLYNKELISRYKEFKHSRESRKRNFLCNLAKFL